MQRKATSFSSWKEIIPNSKNKPQKIRIAKTTANLALETLRPWALLRNRGQLQSVWLSARPNNLCADCYRILQVLAFFALSQPYPLCLPSMAELLSIVMWPLNLSPSHWTDLGPNNTTAPFGSAWASFAALQEKPGIQLVWSQLKT